jgi:hypothetical protein
VTYAAGPEIWLTLSTIAKATLAVEIVGDYVRVRRLLSRTDLRHSLQTLRECHSVSLARDADEAKISGYRLGWAVQRTLRWIPGDTRCIVQSLVLTSLLARRGISSTMVIGVRTGDRFAAHAWIEHAGEAMLPAIPMGVAYDRLTEV